METVRLTGISSRAWELPAERGALAAARQLEGYADLAAALADPADDEGLRAAALAGGVRVGERQLGWVHRLFAEAGETLDVAGLPELVVVADPAPGARTRGAGRPFVTVTSGLLDALDADELRFLLAGQLAHAVSGHAGPRTLLDRLTDLPWPLNPAALLVRSALTEWAHQAEVSADRAAVLATQDPTVAVAALLQLAAPGRVRELDPETPPETPPEPPAPVGPLDQPAERPVHRVAALRRWLDTGDLQRAVGGDYPRRDDDAGAPADEAALAAATTYAETFRATRDRLEQLQAATGTGGVRRWLEGTFRRS